MDTFLENAQRIFDVACADTSGEISDFALLVRRDGGLHLIMDSGAPLDAVAENEGARAAYRVTRSLQGIRVVGRDVNRRCVLEAQPKNRLASELLRDQPLYEINSPRLPAPLSRM